MVNTFQEIQRKLGLPPLRVYSQDPSGSEVDISVLRPKGFTFLDDQVFGELQQKCIRACHDVYIKLNDEKGMPGLLYVVRLEEPCKGLLWPIGGGMDAGLHPLNL